jgi:VWFA-related protein
MRIGSGRLFLSAVSLALGIAFGQLPPASLSARPKLVDLNVVALDNHDQPVGELTADDFQVTDGGKAQRIVFFRHNDAKLQVGPELGPHEFSNRGVGRRARATVILFDLLNDSLGAAGAAGTHVVRSLSRVEAGEDLYLYFLKRNGQVFPVRALPGGEGGAATEDEQWTARIKPIFDRAMSDTLGLTPAYMDIVTRVGLTYGALELLARELAAIPGRKNIVWITHGVPISLSATGGDIVDYMPYLRELCAIMDRSNVAIYPVAQYSGIGSQETLDQFAQLTGGRSKGTADIGATIRQAMNDTLTSYQIGYYPAGDNWDGKYHKLRVTCARKGVRIQSKTGYYAWPDAPAGPQDAVSQVVTGADDAGEIGLRVRVTPSTLNAKAVHLEAHIDARDVAMLLDGERHTAELQVAVAAYGADGRPQGGRVMPLELHLTAAEREQALRKGIEYGGDIEINAAVRKLRVVVADSLLGVAGSVTIPAARLR